LAHWLPFRSVAPLRNAEINQSEAEEEDINFGKNRSGEERVSAVLLLREKWIQEFHKQDQYRESRKN
jgi:hypothetical protein